jgi:GTPase SAR1 family protein
MFYRGAHVVIFLFDVTDIMSFIFVKKLIGTTRLSAPPWLPSSLTTSSYWSTEEVTTSEANTSLPILVGSKCDQHDKRQIQEAEVRTWADVQLLGLSDALCIPHMMVVVVILFRMQGKRIEYREVSACWASEKVQQLFYDIAEQGLKKMLGSSSSSLSSAASTVAQATSLPEWVPDSSGNSCTSCGADFHFSLRRHHCRRYVITII